MALFLQVLEIVAPVLVLAGLGVGWVKLGWDYDVAFVTRLSMTVAVPCLILTALIRTEIDPAALQATIYATIAGYGLVTVGALLLVRLARLDIPTFLPPVIFGNTGNIGLPLALFAFGPAGLDYAVVIFALMAIYSFTIGVWIVSGGGSIRPALREPMVWTTVLGLGFMFTGTGLPTWSMNALDLIGQMGIPLMLVTLGVALARMEMRASGLALLIAPLKLLLCFSAAVFVGRWFDLPDLAFGALVLQMSTPVAVTSYMLAAKYGAGSRDVASLVVVSTLMSIVALPLILGLLI
ncbi:AEC family transporter [Oceanomicrobium pacificus]|uniref:AEC family transporter n=1 Tax=Oceanomicrobium pacificus TaxID=2692916 RepID=A0A6B0TUE2_9RHOB|nr:AEC family transporter [Oceanomicrobium pacificus]MXU64583.1 AEC family transporter [Oceanomicrobium pacificus]